MKSKGFNIKQGTLLKIFALFFAFFLWIYVQAQQVEPIDNTTQSFTKVEIEWMTDPNYDVVAVTNQYVDIIVRGQSSKISNIKDGDITMKLDLRSYKDGKYNIKLTPQLPFGVKLTSITPDNIDIVLDKWITEEKQLEIEYLNELPSELIIEEVVLEPKTVKVRGTRGEMEKIKKVVVPYNLELQGISAVEIKPEARDSSNKTIDKVLINQNVNVNLKIKYRKWLPVKATFNGELPEDITYTIKPARIEVFGQKAELDVITEVFTTEIDISDIKKGDVIEKEIAFQDNLEPSSPDYKTVNITFE
ncbi:hypothetical protein IMX26_14320 [Clostridium sp. 'deep sea']|uniref:CdaR family protein n=1 Tax=Clostridium sp. 'deep sea' TaxID=2779445 RepID=UPI0018967E54|nr:CdaR family protein [Clostridium sp. 'deep sea']QOR34634.1 hypothetical protein IMX26_14320 [Clostridium sp. 'deep sea']